MTPSEKKEHIGKVKVICPESQEMQDELYPLIFPETACLGDNQEDLDEVLKLNSDYQKKVDEVAKMFDKLIDEKRNPAPVEP